MTTRAAPKKQVAFRVRAQTLEHLKRQARETGLSQTELAERYIEEGLRREEHPLIVFRNGPVGRRPGLQGTGLDVWEVVETVRQNASIEDAADYLDLPVQKVQACMGYYADYTDEIDDWIARVHEVAEREQARWLRQQQLAT